MKTGILTSGIVAGMFLLLFAVERWFPLRQSKARLFGRLLVNFVLSGTTFLVAMVAVRPAALAAMNWSEQKPFGLIHLLPLHPVLQFIVSILLLDLAFYYWHVLNHRIPFLWRFHNVHHIDPDLDVSTGFRFHFGEVFFSTAFRVVQVIAIGVSLPTFAIYEIVFQANTLFHHSNVRLPIRLERVLNLIFVTPRMHGIHHSQVRGETNSNYSVVFSWWDRLHRTLGLNLSQKEITIGVPGYSRPEDNGVASALLMPLRPQRDYWTSPDGRDLSGESRAMKDRKGDMVE